MKKYIFLLIIFLIGINLYSIELWNGLDTEMSRETLIDKMKEILQASRVNDTRGVFSTHPSRFRLFNGERQDELNSQFPLMKYDVVWFVTQLPAYKSSPELFFVDVNHLFAVSIPFAADILFNAAVKNYGKNYQIIKENDYYKNILITYKWETNDCIIYLHPYSIYSSPTKLTIINKKLLNELITEERIKEEKYKQEQEERKNAANSGIKF